MELKPGQTAVITGAASGIGRALVRAVADRGLNVVLVDRDEDRLAEAVAELPKGPARYLTAITDVADAAAVDALAARVAAELGPVHLLVNNAGIMRPGSAYDQPLADWHAVIGVNLFGVIHGQRSFVPGMLEHGQPAHVLNTASYGGLAAPSQAAAYSVSKHAAIGLSEVLATDTADTNVGVTVLCPGGVATDIFAAEARRRANEGVTASARTEERFLAVSLDSRPDVDDPADIAEMALGAVERGELFALTFDEPKRDKVRRRLAAIEEALLADETRRDASRTTREMDRNHG